MTAQPTDSARKASTGNFNRQMNLYSRVAAAAGVSVLAMVSPAASEVVVTKANLPIIPLAGVSLDLNHDGVADFYFSLFSYKEFGPSFQCDLTVVPLRGAGVVASHPEFVSYVSELARGAKIGSSARFGPSSSREFIEDSFGASTNGHVTSRLLRGNWGNNPKNRYLGVKFLIDGEIHYGWVRLTVTTSDKVLSIHGTITGYAYETEPNEPIFAGTVERFTSEVQRPQNVQHQPGPSLGMLALGADGLQLWRSEEAANSVLRAGDSR
jgi:hypothetical protein